MILRLTIGQASGRKVEKPGWGYVFLKQYDPFLKVWAGHGYDEVNRDPVEGRQIHDTELLSDHGIEIVPSDEEVRHIEWLRLTRRVARDAAALEESIRQWLHNPAAR